MRVLSAVNVLLWGLLIWLGVEGIKGVESQHVAGYPNDGQLSYYVRFPILMAAVAVALFAFGRFTRFRRTALGLQILVTVTLPFYLFAYTGGM